MAKSKKKKLTEIEKEYKNKGIDLSMVDSSVKSKMKSIIKTNLDLPETGGNGKKAGTTNRGKKLYEDLPTKNIKLNAIKPIKSLSEVDATSKFKIPGNKWDLKVDYETKNNIEKNKDKLIQDNSDYSGVINNINTEYQEKLKLKTDFVRIEHIDQENDVKMIEVENFNPQNQNNYVPSSFVKSVHVGAMNNRKK